MRRRAAVEGEPPPNLLTPRPYPIPPGVDPAAVLLAWQAADDEWRAARDAWVAAGGVWPGGEDQREFGDAVATPDEPFDGIRI